MTQQTHTTATENSKVWGHAEMMAFDIRCARHGVESAAHSIAGYASELSKMALNAEHPDALAHYASVIASEAAQMVALAQYAKGIAAAQARLNDEKQ